MGKTLILFPPTASHLGLLDDLHNRDDVVLFETGYRDTNILGRGLRKVHLSRKVNDIIQLPQKRVWYRRIPSSLFQSNYIDKILIIDGALNYIDRYELKYIKTSHKNAKMFLLLINALDADSPSVNGIKDFILEFPWDEILTFDPKDAQKYGMTYRGFCYYSYHAIDNCINTKPSDICFTGGLKGGRDSLILDSYHYLTQKGVTCDYRIMTYTRQPSPSESGITFYSNGWRPYTEVLSMVYNSNCIMEILQKGQSGASLRYFEAVCYNKKLLTNNKNIVDFPYYNPLYMRFFSSLLDIDINWILSKDSVDYEYKGDFSPNTLIDNL